MYKTLEIVAIRDTHNRHKEVVIPECDILVHAGDYSLKGYDGEIERFYKWLNKQPAKHIVSVQGNHEVGWERSPYNCISIAVKHCPNVHLLNNTSITIEGIKIHGMPDTPYFCNWAFNRARNDRESMLYDIPLMKKYTDNIPNDTNILVTHGPPYGILDLCPDGRIVGCEDLMDRVNIVKPDVHIFGHIHHSHGEKHINGTSFYNAAICDEMYYPSNPITEIEYLTGE